MLKYFVEMGVDIRKIHEKSTSKITLMHVAAQGESPSTMALIKSLLTMDDPLIVNRRDCKMASPLHWACYAGAESAA
jgi:hypothetical protein